MANQKRYFEWIAGDDIGNVVVLESMEEVEGEIVYNFDDGETVNQRFISPMTDTLSDLREKVMVEVENPSNVWRIETVQPKIYKDMSMEGESFEIPTLHDVINAGGDGSMVESNVGSSKLVPPSNPQRKRELPKLEDYKVKSEPVRGKEVVETLSNKDSDKILDESPKNVSIVEERKAYPETRAGKSAASFDPVTILVEKCKKHPTKIDLELTIDLPSKSMYAIADSEFENGGESFIEHVVSDIDTKIIIDELREALRRAYGAVRASE